MFTRIDSILPDTLKKNDLAPKVARAYAFEVFEEAVRHLLLPEQVVDCKALRLDGGILTIACKSSAVAGALRARQTELTEYLTGGGVRIERFRLLFAPWR